MAQTYHIAELDENTQEYLFAVRDSEGHKMPGVFVASKNYLPLIGIILGPILIIAVLIFTLGSFDDPTRTAMLQTAAIMLGGWMITAAIRVWVLQRTRSYLGHFVYADSARLYEAKGSMVKITSLKSLLGANATDNYNEGSYQNTVVELELANEGGYSLTVSDQDLGRRFVTFLNALAYVRAGSAGDISNLSTWDVGQTALALAEADPMPNLSRKPAIARELGDIPKPKRANMAPQGLIAIGVIVLLTIITFFIMKGLNTPLRDDAIFEMIKSAQTDPGVVADAKRPPFIRTYLIDSRNTRHTKEIQDMVARFYETPLRTIQANPRGDPDLKRGFVAIVKAISTAPQPLVSMRVKEKLPDNRKLTEAEQKELKDREAALEKRLIDTLNLVVSDGAREADNKTFREDMIALVRFNDPDPKENVKDPLPPVMLDISYTLVPHQPQPPAFQVKWTVELRDKPDAKAICSKPLESAPQQGTPKEALVKAASELLLNMVGSDQTTAVAQAQPPGQPGASHLNPMGGVAQIQDQLNQGDARDRLQANSFCKVYTVDMTQGRTYQIDHMSGAFDARLRLESPEGNHLLANDDVAPGNLNSRIVYPCPRPGRYRIIATTLGPNETGMFTLRVHER